VDAICLIRTGASSRGFAGLPLSTRGALMILVKISGRLAMVPAARRPKGEREPRTPVLERASREMAACRLAAANPRKRARFSRAVQKSRLLHQPRAIRHWIGRLPLENDSF
jgi:hypothetical protein